MLAWVCWSDRIWQAGGLLQASVVCFWYVFYSWMFFRMPTILPSVLGIFFLHGASLVLFMRCHFLGGTSTSTGTFYLTLEQGPIISYQHVILSQEPACMPFMWCQKQMLFLHGTNFGAFYIVSAQTLYFFDSKFFLKSTCSRAWSLSELLSHLILRVP